MYPVSLILSIIIFAVISYVRLEWGVYLVLLLLPTYLLRFTFFIPLTLLEVFILILFTLFVLTVRSKVLFVPALRRYAIPIGVIVVAATISVFVASDIRSAAGLWKAYFIEPILFFWVVNYAITSKKQIRNVIFSLVFSAIAVSIFAYIQKITGNYIPHPWNLNEEFRVTGPFGYPNALALYISPIIVLFWGHIVLFAKKIFVPFLLIIFLFLCGALVFSKSVAGIAAVFIGCTIISFLKKPKITSLILILLLSFLLLNPQYSAPVLREITFSAPSGQTRLLIWQASIQMVRDHPFAGVGLAGYEVAFENYRPTGYREKVLYPHNIILNFYLELGLLGLLGFLWLIGQVVYSHLQSYRRGHLYGAVFFAGFASLVLFGFVDVPYFKNDLAVLWWILCLPLASTE